MTDETNVCYLCETTHDCAEGNEVKALSGEWVCLSCQDKLVSELAPKWVNVEDGLPEDGEEILMFMGDGAVMSDLRHHTGRFSAKYGFERSRVTDWMPLLAPPKTNKLEGGE